MKKYSKVAIVIFIISIILELFVFNFRYFLTLNYNPVEVDNINYSKNIKKDDDNLIISNGDYIELKNINKNVNNIKLDIDFLSSKDYLSYKIYAKDEGNRLYYELPSRYLYKNIEKSKYITLDLSGKAKSLKIEFNLQDNEEISLKINNIFINNTIPIDISYTRLVLTFLGIFILYIISPKSELYKYKIDLKNKFQKLIVVIILIVQAFSFFYVSNANEFIKNLENYSNHTQYKRLAHSFANGKVYIEPNPSDELKKLDNPYDTGYRNKVAKEKGELFEWDTAYYNGKYYVYFGVVPVLVSYLPYHILTGNDLPNQSIVFIVSVIAMFGLFLLLKEIIKRYFPNTSFLLFMILYIFMSFGSGLLLILGYPTLYNVPISFALMFTYFGLYFFLSSIKEDKISKLRIFFGSLCMALVAGCRPQLLLFSFLTIPIFFEEVFKKRTLFSKKSIGATICFVIPYIVVAVFLMYYNYIRFGSVFDFGANYNLTGNDMTRRGFKLDRIGLGLFSYLLQPFNITASFPFLTPSTFTTNFMGTTIREVLYGGCLFASPLLIIGVIFFKFKKIIPKNLFYICLISVISAFLIIIMDTQMAGILPRYMSDFLPFFYLSTIIVILSIFNSKIPKKYLQVILSIILCLIIFTLCYWFLYTFIDQYLYDMLNNSTEFYFKWYYLLQWWL